MVEIEIGTDAPAGPLASRDGLLATGSLLGALAASSCCVLPLALFSAGLGGAWIGAMTSLAPYQPLFVVPTLGLLGWGYWHAYRRPNLACASGACGHASSTRMIRAMLWAASALLAVSLAFPYFAAKMLDV